VYCIAVACVIVQRQVRWIPRSSRGETNVELLLVVSCFSLLLYT